MVHIMLILNTLIWGNVLLIRINFIIGSDHRVNQLTQNDPIKCIMCLP